MVTGGGLSTAGGWIEAGRDKPVPYAFPRAGS